MAHKETYTGVAPVLDPTLALVHVHAVGVDVGDAVSYSFFRSIVAFI